MKLSRPRLGLLGPMGLVALIVAAPTCAKEPAPPAPAISEAAVTKINYETCAVVGTKGDTTVIYWQPVDSKQPVEVRWETTDKPKGYTVKIKPLTGPGEQSPSAERQSKILEMFALKYEIGKDGQTVISGVPTNPPFGPEKEVRWKYQVQVLDSDGKVVCGKDPDVCVSKPGGCGG